MATVIAIAGSTDKRAMACLILKESQRLCNDKETQAHLSGPAVTTGHTLARCKGPPQMVQGVVILFTLVGSSLLDVELLAGWEWVGLRNPCRMLTVFAISGSTDKRAMACLMLKENQRLCNDMET